MTRVIHIFEGSIHPVPVGRQPPTGRIKIDHLDVVVDLAFEGDSFTLTAETNEAAAQDADWLRNSALEVAQVLVDAWNFEYAYSLRLQVARVRYPDGRTERVDPGFPGLREVDDYEPLTEDERAEINVIFQLLPYSAELRMALMEVRRAIESGLSTVFHCYRAIETIRLVFEEVEDSRSQTWDRMWSALGADRALVESFRERATEVRHGRFSEYTHAERATALANTRSVVRLFVGYLERQRGSAPTARE